MPDDLTDPKTPHMPPDPPQGTRDSEMPQSPNPFGGQVGPSPSDDDLPFIDLGETPGQGEEAHETGEEPDPGVFEAGV